MCTLTWQSSPSGYRILFNRDERHSRPAALPPRRVSHAGTEALMPIDSLAGGTWISVNSRGLCFCLLNNYGAEQLRPLPGAPSRGILAAQLANCATPEEAKLTFYTLAPRRLNPFDLFVFDSAGTPQLFSWNGLQLEESSPESSCAFSAGFDTAEVGRSRRELLRRWQAENLDLLEYHRSHLPEPGARSVCMHRKEAATQSLTEVQIHPDHVSLTYWPGPPCNTTALPPLILQRAH